MMLSWLSTSSLATFLLASLLLGVSPGPGVLYIVTTATLHGRRHGLMAAAAMAIGNLACGVVVALLLATLLNLSSQVFTVLRFAGAAYLVYLGVKLLFIGSERADQSMPVSSQRTFVDGLLVALLNPKTLMFFAAFLPQYMTPEHPSFAQGWQLVLVFVLIALITDSVYALAAGWLATPLQRSRRAQSIARIVGAGVFMILGALAALA